MKKLTFTDRMRGFQYALNGLLITWKEEPNMILHLLGSLLAILAAWYFDLTLTEWNLILFSIGLVWTAETFNTAIENLCDAVTLEHNEHIGKAKDVSAAAVLVASITAATIGIIVFGPKVWDWIAA